MAIDPRLEAGRVVYYPTEFGPHHIILAGITPVHFRYLVIKTQPSPWQKTKPEQLKHFVKIDQKNHTFLKYDSVIFCGQLHAERIYNISQHVREKSGDVKDKISENVRARILGIVRDKTLKLLSEEERAAITKYLGAV